MRKLLVLCAVAALALSGACVTFDPSGQAMNDDAVAPDPDPEVDAGTPGTLPDADPPPPVDARPEAPDARDEPDDPPEPDGEPDNSGPGGGGDGPGGDGPGGGGGD